MHWLKRSLSSSIGLKAVMAITGICLFLFLIMHLTGNLLSYKGTDAFNTYAQGMQSLGGFLWIARLGLLFVFILHISVAVQLTRKNKLARPVAYAAKATVQASYASRTMPMSGLIILFFLLFHLAHYTLYWVHPEFANLMDEKGRHDAYQMLILGFQSIPISALYIVAMLILGMHLSHGLSSLFQSLGINHVNFNPIIRCAGPTLAWLMVAGFISIPVSVMLGVISLGQGVNP